MSRLRSKLIQLGLAAAVIAGLGFAPQLGPTQTVGARLGPTPAYAQWHRRRHHCYWTWRHHHRVRVCYWR